jgi:hypothetical protein
MENWQKVWREGFAPVLTMNHLKVLAQALEKDDPRLIQGGTTQPPPLMEVQDHEVDAACAIGFCGWQGDKLETVGEVEEFFAHCCFAADQKLEEASACRWFLNWFDDTPRPVVREQFLTEVLMEISRREEVLARENDCVPTVVVMA